MFSLLKNVPLSFLLAQLLISPISIVYCVSLVASCLLFARSAARKGASVTAAWVLYVRWFMHEIQARSDHGSKLLYEVHPMAPPRIMSRMFTGAQRFALWLSGIKKVDKRMGVGGMGTMEMVPYRLAFFDSAIEEARPEQLVVMGAGFDTRAYGPDRPRRTGGAPYIFEVDMPSTQRSKIELLDRSGLQRSHVNFVACDFNKDSWKQKLYDSGFDPKRRTFFLWEGVSYYLPEEVVVEFLRVAAQVLSHNPVNRLGFDFLDERVVAKQHGRNHAHHSPSVAIGAAAGIVRSFGEPFLTGIPNASARAWLRERVPQLTLVQHHALTKCGLALVSANDQY